MVRMLAMMPLAIAADVAQLTADVLTAIVRRNHTANKIEAVRGPLGEFKIVRR